jgi:hypothetical protein
VPVDELDWVPPADPQVLQLRVHFPDGFSPHIVYIDDERIDPYFNSVRFSFQASCPSDLDCEPPEHPCPPDESVPVDIDYRARDFWSLRQALLDFASLHYPDWADRLEADAGVMLVEVMSALGDELAYYQDRIGREAYLETATQRRSLRRHARLVDYEIYDGLAASAWLDVTVKNGESGDLEAGIDIWAKSHDGHHVHYEIGRGLAEVLGAVRYPVDSELNTLKPHIWDEDATCLPLGATSVFVKGHVRHKLPWDGEGRCWVLLKTNPMTDAMAPRRWLARLLEDKAQELNDPLQDQPQFGNKVTQLVWEEAQAMPFELDLTARFEVRANLVPVTAGRTLASYFVISAEPDDPNLGILPEAVQGLTRAVERQGPNGVTAYLHTLPGSETTPLCWLEQGHPPPCPPRALPYGVGEWHVGEKQVELAPLVAQRRCRIQALRSPLHLGRWYLETGRWLLPAGAGDRAPRLCQQCRHDAAVW